MSAEREQEPLPANRIMHYQAAEQEEPRGATPARPFALQPLELSEEEGAELERRIAGMARRQEEYDERAYEESVQHYLSDLRYEGWYWTYGDFQGVGHAIALARQSQRESDTGASEEQPDEHSLEPMEDEQAARTEATRRNRGADVVDPCAQCLLKREEKQS